MIRMIVTDLDGTLLRRDKTVSNYTVDIFRRCVDADIKIVFATARPVRAVTKCLNIDLPNDACIYHNGAISHIGGELFKEIGIAPATVCDLLGTVSKLENMRVAVEINDVLYANFDASTIWAGIEFIMTDFSDIPNLPADKIIFITVDKAEIDAIEKILVNDLYWEISENEVLMVMNKNARKLCAVKEIANYFKISLAETVAFGDDYNDIEMLRECGVGVAVANAIDECKVAANDICDINENDGVAKWIDERILQAERSGGYDEKI